MISSLHLPSKFYGKNIKNKIEKKIIEKQNHEQNIINNFFSPQKAILNDEEYANVFDSVNFHQWKRLRAIGSPSFSAMRMKEVRFNIIGIFSFKYMLKSTCMVNVAWTLFCAQTIQMLCLIGKVTVQRA